MPRRGNVPKREVLPDPLYNSVLVTKLTNSIMLDGKKGVAQKVVYGAFDIIKEKTDKEPMEVPGSALADHLCPRPWREDHEGASGRRDHGRRQQHRFRREEARGYPQDGRVQQGFRPLPLVIKESKYA